MSAIDSWTNDIWNKINGQAGPPPQPGLLKTVMGKIRVAQQVFPTTVRGNDNPVPADTIDLKTGIPTAGLTKPVVTITKSFQLADMHVKDLPDLSMAMNQVTLAGQSLALVEDMLFFQGQDAKVPADVKVTTASDLGSGLLGRAAEINKPIPVEPLKDKKGVYGSNTFAAVTEGIAKLGANLQGAPYALLLDPGTYADAHLPLQDSNIVTPASAIQALVNDGGFFMATGLPARTGLLVSLGGATTKLFVGTEPTVEFSLRDQNGVNFFSAKESIQFVNIDARSLTKLEFK